MRKIVFWLHLGAGVTTGVVVVWMSFTGVLLAYEKQLTAWFDRGAFRSSGSTAMPLEELLRPHAKPNMNVVLRADPREPVELTGPVYLDASTGRDLGKPTSARARFSRRLRPGIAISVGTGRAAQRRSWLTGVCNLAFFVMVLSGAYLWIPRKWSWQHLRPVLWFRGGLSGKARDFNWHNTLGIWCFVPLAVVVAGAIPISFVWASNFVYRAAGSPVPPPVASPKPAESGQSRGSRFARRARQVAARRLDHHHVSLA
jgi:uncharacterized iron-regulated membrane protein